MKKGFTLIELLLAVSLSGVIFVVVSSLLMFVVTSDLKNKRQEAFEQVKNDMQIELSNAVRWGKEISYSAGELVIDGVTYRLLDGRMYKNADPITSAGVTIKSFGINNFSNDLRYVSLSIDLEMEDRSYALSNDVLTIVVSQRKTQLGESI